MNCFALKKEEGNEVYLLHFIRIGSNETSNLFHCFSLIDYFQPLYASDGVLVNARTKLDFTRHKLA
jgi:hypothetical protein